MHNPRCVLSRVGLFSKPELFPWCSRKPPGWSQLFPGSSCKGNFIHVITKKCQSRQKKPSHLGPLDCSQERLANVVMPLWRLSYEKQLKIVIDGYQNKSTFSVNGPDGNLKTMGHYLGTWRGQNIVCLWSTHLKNIPEKHSQVAQYYELFLRQSSVEPCLLFHEGGHWCELTVRTNNQGHTVAIITFHPQELRQEEICVQKETVKEFFIKWPGAVCDLTSVYFRESTMTRCSHQQSSLFGEPHVFEELLGLKICISPDTFCQINTAVAEMLFQTMGKLSGVNSNTILLDICCGTAVIGLSLAQYTSQILGIELVQQAVEDARWTAAFNCIINCEFHAGRTEKIFPQLLKSKEDGQSIVAVVNPARAGLHYQVIQAIRNCRAIHTLVFISCKPHGETTKIIELCCPLNFAKRLLGEPFVLKQAVPVDQLFPHSLHCELVPLFAR
ncbi:LOW QUALITY PROTEIN: tRNA (uracil-5-)-methyltransferase homolog B [Rhynchonycteris naso]